MSSDPYAFDWQRDFRAEARLAFAVGSRRAHAVITGVTDPPPLPPDAVIGGLEIRVCDWLPPNEVRQSPKTIFIPRFDRYGYPFLHLLTKPPTGWTRCSLGVREVARDVRRSRAR